VTDGDNLELRKRARRRLVGAAALALLAAIVLPMIMDDEPGLTVQDIQVTIPDRNADTLQSRPIANRQSTPAESDPDVAPAPQEQPPAAAVRSGEEGSGGGQSVAPGESPQPRDLVESGAGQQAVRKPVSQTPATGEKPDEAARVQAILEGRQVSSANARAYVVQVGAFSDPGKANVFGTDLKGKGFTAYTEQSGSVTRVRVGPFNSREEAEKVAARLEALGFGGVVTSR